MAGKNNITEKARVISEDLLRISSALELLRQEFIKISGSDSKKAVEAVNKLSGKYDELQSQLESSRETAIRYQKQNTKNAESNDLVAKSLRTVTAQSSTFNRTVKEKLSPTISENNLQSRALSQSYDDLTKSSREVVTQFGSEIKSIDALTRSKEKNEDVEERIQKKVRAQSRATKLWQLREEVDLLNRGAAVSNDFFKEIQLRVKAENKLEDAIKRQNVATRDATKTQKTFGQAIADSFSPRAIGAAIGNVVKFVGLYQILGAALSFVKDLTIGSANAFIEFENKIGKLNSVLLTSKEQLAAVSESIRSTAVQTRFTAGEVADLAVSLAKLGATSSEIPSLLSPIATAAQATGESLDKTGETILKVNNQFGISAAESAITASTLTAAINDSALSLDSFNTAIQYIGPVASQVGFTFAETAEYMKSLADNGFNASRIGTGLRTIFIKLKKPGEDLSKTLDDLAKKNISVAEASELVDRRAAAQLLTILRTKEAFDEEATAAKNLGLSLASSAAQMSTFSGQVDILKSAFEEFRLKIGESIVNTEFFLELIGLFDEDSEALARGYKLINQVFQQNTDALSENIDAVYAGNSAYGTIVRTLEDSDIQVTKLRKTFGQLTSNLQRSGSNLTLDEAFEAFVLKVSDGADAVNEYLDSIGKNTGKNAKLIIELGESVFPGDLEDETLAVFGYFRRVQDGVEQLRQAAKAEEDRSAIQKKYKEDLEKVEALGVKSLAAQNDALILETKIREERSKIIDLQKIEQAKGAGASRGRLLQYQAEISGLDEYLQRLSEFNNDLVETDSEVSKAKLKQFNLRKKALDNEREELENSAKQEEIEHKRRISQIEQRTKAEVDSLATLEEKQNAESRGVKAINEERSRYAETLDSLNYKTAELSDKASDLFKEYGKIFSGNADNLLYLENTQDQFGLSIKKLIQDLGEARTKSQLTSEELGLELYQRGTSLVSNFSKSLSLLADQYEDTAFGQYQLGMAQREYVAQAKKYLGDLEKEYEGYFIAFSAVFGEDTAREILAPFKFAIDTISESLNTAITDGVISDDEIKELKTKFLKLSDTLAIPIEIVADAVQQASDVALEALSRYNDVALENTKNRLEREKDLIKDRFETEDQILKAKLDNQLITDAEYRAQVEKNRKKEAQAQNKIDFQIFQAEQKRDRQKALSDYLTSLASIIPSLILSGTADPVELLIKYGITAGLATTAYGLELNAIKQTKFFPTKFAEGGIVTGPSHEQGGIPFSVAGQGGYEMEGGEYIVNKKATQKYKSILDQINNYGKSSYKFADGGIVNKGTSLTTRQVELLEVIAETNISLVGKLDKPVRAFVASDDLRSDSNALRIKERNSQL